ncbi:MAG: hypothetical protein Q3M24_07535 [Candidatus Electrothrix aestuarii]|uniref:Uncharacterized protein n=1 Tax=Candidatus Electrothrix aestuarii TaxID=3062594 RepID=A0AAU8LZD8_9BACT|nr:hypothetical protein [Candidatus Electrothrix aestuarii]WPD23545.1 MAG: hypothetical protein SD837_03070 [Candidatus Electrothrix sp. GW3-3]
MNLRYGAGLSTWSSPKVSRDCENDWRHGTSPIIILKLYLG